MNERRQLGAVLAIERTTRQGPEVFFLRDTSKTELSGGFSDWHQGPQECWSLIAGGRSVTDTGQEESVWQTLSREAAEELADAEAVSSSDLEVVLTGLTHLELLAPATEQLLYPIVVAQVCEHTQAMNILAVTSILLQFDAIPQEEQHLLEQAVDHGAAVFEKYSTVVRQLLPGSGKAERSFRQPSITTATLWFLQKYFDQLDQITQRALTRTSNRTVYRQAHAVATQRNLRINNGAWNADGSVSSSISAEEAVFLGLQE